jgi:hypothetical protein
LNIEVGRKDEKNNAPLHSKKSCLIALTTGSQNISKLSRHYHSVQDLSGGR